MNGMSDSMTHCLADRLNDWKMDRHIDRRKMNTDTANSMSSSDDH